MADSVIPAAAPPATPAAPVTPPAVDSLLPPVAPPAAAPVVPPVTPPVAAPVTAPAPAAAKWFYAEGVEGKGTTPPDWFKQGKYVNVEQQAKAYNELEKRFGAFVGSPDGEYVITVPDEYKEKVQIDTTHPVFAKLNEWGKKHQLSQQGYNDVIGLLTEYEASVAPPAPKTVDDVKKELGPNADVRLTAVASYAAANLDAEGQKSLRAALAVDNPAIKQTLEAIERVIAKTRQPAMPKPGSDVPAPGANELAEINAMQAKVGADGKRLYVTDSAYRAKVEERRTKYYQALRSPV